MSDEGVIGHATSSIPIVTDREGQAYIPADAVVILLRAMAESCRNLADDPDCDLLTLSEAMDREADNLDCMAIARTT